MIIGTYDGDLKIPGRWTSFTQFKILHHVTPYGYMWSVARLTTIRPDLSACDQKYGQTCQRILSRKKKQWAKEKLKLDNS